MTSKSKAAVVSRAGFVLAVTALMSLTTRPASGSYDDPEDDQRTRRKATPMVFQGSTVTQYYCANERCDAERDSHCCILFVMN